MTEPVDHAALERGERVRKTTPALPAHADAAFRLRGLGAVYVREGVYVCPPGALFEALWAEDDRVTEHLAHAYRRRVLEAAA